MLSIFSWNVNGLRAVLKKDALRPLLDACQPNILCLQETKALETDIPTDALSEFSEVFFHSAEKKGYSGTAILSKVQPESVSMDFPEPFASEHPREGRILTAEYSSFYLVNVYVPNSKRELLRLPYRQGKWDVHFAQYLKDLGKKKPVIATGDFNVAHKEIDLANPKNNLRNAGFTQEERDGFSHILDHAGLIDSFRHLYPEARDAYSWWSYRAGARKRNIGWRIDYVLLSKALENNMAAAKIHPEIMGSDHCPVSVTLKDL